jgi:hypothetical protein
MAASLLAPTSTHGGMPGALRWLFWGYFATHIPITLLIDAQVYRHVI